MLKIPRFDVQEVLAMSIHDALYCMAVLKGVRQEYTAFGVTEPEWLGDQSLRLERRIRDLRHDQMAHRAGQLRSMIAAKMPEEQQVAAWQQELQKLEAALTA
jgi:Asp-tRNA(Asn)/Glu-tRNA(Gln) amidotransferase A subunit family amidase